MYYRPLYSAVIVRFSTDTVLVAEAGLFGSKFFWRGTFLSTDFMYGFSMGEHFGRANGLFQNGSSRRDFVDFHRYRPRGGGGDPPRGKIIGPHYI